MNKKGFITMTLVYTFLVLFLFLMLGVLHAYSEKNKFLQAIDDKIDLRFTTPTNYGKTILQTLLSVYYAEESGIIDYSKNSEGRYQTRTGITQDITSKTNGFYFTQVVDDEDNNKIHMTEDDKVAYFFRGTIDDNYIVLGNNCWKIYRTNEDESTRVVYYGPYNTSTNTCTFNLSKLPRATYNNITNNNMYVGYMYGNNSSSYDVTHSNNNNSSIKTALDNWYISNLSGTQYEKYIDDQIFCNERKIGIGGNFNGKTYTMNGYGNSNTLYQSLRRNGTDGTEGTTISMSVAYPIFRCEQPNDKFTKNNASGNKKLTYPIGTLTADEFIIAGGSFQIDNTTDLLYYNTDLWTMTPSSFTSGVAKAISVKNNGELIESNVNETHYILPVISLKNTTLIESGNGKIDSPYIIKVK